MKNEEQTGSQQKDAELLELRLKQMQMVSIARDELHSRIGVQLNDIISALRELKGTERSSMARACAIVITMLEQARAYFVVYVK